jgi:predicted enzyme related to lactoylglutathione lyase
MRIRYPVFRILLAALSAEMLDRMKIENALASIAVKDLKAASAWYERLFGRPADSTPMPEVAEWKFERGGWLQVYELAKRAGAGSCTLAVNEIAGVIAHLQSLGIDTSEASSGARVKTVMITDPDGNHIAFAEAIDPTLAR